MSQFLNRTLDWFEQHDEACERAISRLLVVAWVAVAVCAFAYIL